MERAAGILTLLLGVVATLIGLRYPLQADKDEFLLFLGRADEEKAPHLAIEAARRAGRRLVMCATTKNERERNYWADQVEPVLDDDVEVRASAARTTRPICWPGHGPCCSRPSGRNRSAWS